MLRHLRPGCAMLCLLVASLLIVLWGRSCSYCDSFDGPLPSLHVFEITTRDGSLSGLVSGPAFKRDLWNWSSRPIPGLTPATTGVPNSSTFRFRVARIQGRYHIITPLWLPALLSVAMAAAIGIRRPYQFGLRALLIATTFVAVVLGLAVALSR